MITFTCRLETPFLPGSPPLTPVYETVDRSGECQDKTAFGPPSFNVENSLENVFGGPAGGPDQPRRFGSRTAGDISTWHSSSEVTSTGRSRTQELGARAKTRDSHAHREPRSQTSGMSAAVGLDSAHRGTGGRPAEISDDSDVLVV